MSKSHWKDESRNSLWWHWWKPWWSIYTWQMNNTMWIKQHTRHKRVCCFLRCCCCVVRRVRTWEEEEKLWAIPISRRPPSGHFINYFGLLTAHSIQNLFWTQFRVTTQSQSDGYQPTNLGDDDSENAPTTTAIYSNDPPMAKVDLEKWLSMSIVAFSSANGIHTANALFSLSVDIIDSVWQILRR